MGPAYRRLLPYVYRYRRQFALGLCCVVITTSIQLLSPWVLKHAIDDLNGGITRQKLALYAAIIVGIGQSQCHCGFHEDFVLAFVARLDARARDADADVAPKSDPMLEHQ